MHDRKTGPLRVALAFTLTVVVAACGDEDDEGGGGSPPSISALTYDDTVLAAGAQGTVDGGFAFEDADADLDTLLISVSTPGGQSQSFPPTELQGVSGMPSGMAAFVIALIPPSAGEYGFTLKGRDAAGNESNELSGTIAVE